MADLPDRERETPEEIKARKERERDELYALDISGVEWHCAPGTEEHEERVEIAYLPAGAVAMRSSKGYVFPVAARTGLTPPCRVGGGSGRAGPRPYRR